MKKINALSMSLTSLVLISKVNKLFENTHLVPEHLDIKKKLKHHCRKWIDHSIEMGIPDEQIIELL